MRLNDAVRPFHIDIAIFSLTYERFSASVVIHCLPLIRKVMQKSRLLTLLTVALAPLSLFAQRTVQLGAYRFVPEQNLAQSLPLGNRGHVRFDVTQLGPSVGGRHNALVQFQAQPTAHDLQRLEALGITLGDYVGGYAYYALV